MENINKLYMAFKEFKKPVQIEGCPCCINDEEITTLLTTNLKDIKPKDITAYASSAFLTVGSKADFLYFFPRIFEISLTDDSFWPDPEVLFNAVIKSDYNKWNDEQKSIVTSLLNLKFIDTLNTDEMGSDIDQWLCALARITEDLSPYLELIESHPHKRPLIKFVEWNLSGLPENKLGNGFWEECPSQEKQVISWLKQGQSALYLRNTYGIDL